MNIKPDEVQYISNDTMAELNKRYANVEEMVAEFHDKMRRELAHSGKEFKDVGKKKQNRHISQIQ